MRLLGSMHPVPVVAGVIVAVIAIQLGNWQLRRASEKHEISLRIAQFAGSPAERLASAHAPAPAEWSRVSVQGEWLEAAVMLHDNRVHERRPGYHVLMPLRLADGSAVLVNRGWVAAGLDRSEIPAVRTSTGVVEVSGRVMVPEHDPFSLGDSPRDGVRWQYIDPTAYAEWSGVSVPAWVIQQTSPEEDGLLREWPAPALGEDTHKGYALQWFSLAALAAALTGVYVFRSIRKHAT